MEEEKYAKQQRIYKIVMLVILTIFITFMVTSLSLYTYFSKNPITMNSATTVSGFGKIRNVIDKYYLWKDDINENELSDAAIKGYVSGLGDKYTEYIPKNEIEEFQDEVTGTFTGIGISMTADKEKGVVVYEPLPDSPAENAGIKSGDVIKKIDGKEFDYDNFDTITDSIKGEEGTNVNIVIERDGEEKEFEITRERISSNNVTAGLIDKNIGYMYIPSFDQDTGKYFKENLDSLIKKGATSLIIDLRQNGGGIVDEAEKIADLFLEKDVTIMTTRDNKGNENVTKTKSEKQYDLPIIILGNGSTASASEILIGALKDNNRAKFVGTKTFGKGIIQVVVTLVDGSALKITNAEYITPNGTAIHGVGITPDIEVKLSDSKDENEDKDNQLNRAIEELKK